jgi:hypothetical protein
MRIGISGFVKRQTKESQFTHYHFDIGAVASMAERAFDEDEFSKGYRDGVVIVHLPEDDARWFYTYTDFPMFEGMKLKVGYKKTPGREHEPARVQVEILEPKKQCNFVDVILYRADVLEEDGDRSTNAEWEVVSINGRLKEKAAPIDPLTIVRNYKHLPGGTEMKGKTPEEVLDMLCDSILHQNNMENLNDK